MFVIITRTLSGEKAICGDLTAHNPVQITVPALSEEDSVKFLHNIADLGNVPQTIIDTILSRAEGNPFYIEEFLRMLIEKAYSSLYSMR